MKTAFQKTCRILTVLNVSCECKTHFDDVSVQTGVYLLNFDSLAHENHYFNRWSEVHFMLSQLA